MRGIAKEAGKRGTLVIVGNGNLAQANDFAKKQGRGLRSLVDSKRETYDAMHFQYGANLRQATLATLKGIAAASRGHIQTDIQGDARQMGGTLVVRTGGRPVFFHRSDHAGDHPPVSDVLAALQAAAS